MRCCFGMVALLLAPCLITGCSGEKRSVRESSGRRDMAREWKRPAESEATKSFSDAELSKGGAKDIGGVKGSPDVSRMTDAGAGKASSAKWSTPPAKVGGASDAKKADPVAPVAVAEAVAAVERPASRPVKDQGPASGILTAGSFDDNLDPIVFRSFVSKMGQRQDLGDLPGKLNGHRLLILVKDAAGKPLGGARVKVGVPAGSGVEIVTRADGRAVFALALEQLPAGQALEATVMPADGSGAVTEIITPGAPRWEITLPKARAELPKHIDLAFVVDTTGSMTDELLHLKAEVKGISAAIKKMFPEVRQRFALVLYRDAADEYVTRSFDFTDSLDEFHRRLAAQSATGGGDYPEAMHKAVEEANQLRWRDADVARVLFLIGDAPPHAQHVNRTFNGIDALRRRGIGVYPVACSGYDDACEFVMRASAFLTGSRFLFLTDDSGVGNAHAEPKIPYYQVERLERLMVRMIAGELTGRTIDAAPADILRTVGKKIN